MDLVLDVAVDFIRVCGFYDGPLDGWLRAKSHYYYFKEFCEETWYTGEIYGGDPDIDIERIYSVYQLKPEITTVCLIGHRNFLWSVGWHNAYRPGENRHSKDRQSRYKRTSAKWASYYYFNRPKLEFYENDRLEGSTLVGSTLGGLHHIHPLTALELAEQFQKEICMFNPKAKFR